MRCLWEPARTREKRKRKEPGVQIYIWCAQLLPPCAGIHALDAGTGERDGEVLVATIPRAFSISLIQKHWQRCNVRQRANCCEKVPGAVIPLAGAGPSTAPSLPLRLRSG